MAFRRHALVAFVAAALSSALPASAAPTIIPKVLQCDGSYSPGTATSHPAPLVRADVTDPTGLRVGAARMGAGSPGAMRALWRFDGGVSVSSQCVVSAACGGAGCREYLYTYADANASAPLIVGKCVYNSLAADCSTDDGLFLSTPVPVGLGACPAAVPPVGANTIFTTGGQFGSAGSFTGIHAASAPASATWDRPATYTLSAWIRSSGAGYQRILSQQNPLLPGQYWGFGLDGGALRHFDSRDALADPDISFGSGLTNGAWHKVDVVRVNSDRRYFYIDGARINSTPATSTNSFAAHSISSAVHIGAYAGGGEAFVGDIDEIRVVDAALSADEIMLEYQGTFHKYSGDAGVGYSTVAANFSGGPPPNGTAATWTYTPTEPWTSNSRWIFAAQSTNTNSTIIQPYAPTRDTGVPSAPTLSGTGGTNSISWAWNTPSKICTGTGLPIYYELWDARTGAVTGPLLLSPALEGVAGANQSSARMVRVHDNWGFSSLSAAATAYTLAAQPSGLALTGVSTGGVVVTWNPNANPGYTRYEVTYSPDAFAATTSTRVAIGDGFTGLTTNLTGLATGTDYSVRVRAFNGQASDFSGGLATNPLTGTFTTRPGAPVLTGTADSATSLHWSWTQPSGSSGYNLYDTPTLSLLGAGAAAAGAVVTISSVNLSVNTRYDAQVESYAPAPSGAGLRGSDGVYTLAMAPVAPIVSAMYSSSGVFSWNANGNPSYTNYELSVATDSSFSVVIATIGVSGTTATLGSLLPGTSYYARVRAFNGDQIPAPPAGFVAFPAAATLPDVNITVSSAPPSPYVAPVGLAGAWQFDEGSGLASADGSGAANTARFTCTAALCASTPTFASGPAGLGTAASFAGLEYGVVETQSDFSAFNTGPNNDMTVEAWVYPQSTSQRDNAGLVAVGAQGAEDFALDIASGRFRFLAAPGSAASAAALITAGAWTHVVGVYDSAAAAATLYLNGVAAAAVAGVPARANSGQRLSLGNRKAAGGAYTLPFYGRLDSVRILHRALNASEVLSGYRGGFVSTITPPSPNSAVLVAFPPNAFTSPVQVYISADPVAHPVRIPYATLSAGLSALPSGLTLVPNSIVEVVPVIDGQAFTATLGSSATVSIPYGDADGNNLVDGTVLPAAGIRMYTLNTTVNRWEALSTSVDPVNRRASGLTPHFSVFALFAPSTIGSGLSGVRVYPVPWKPGSGGRFDGPGLTFDNLPASGGIRILTLAGERVADLRFDGLAAGLMTWDGRTAQGRRCASGVYFAKISSDAGGSMIVKFAIER